MQGKSKKNLWFKRKYSEKAFVGTVCVDMGFFLWNGFSPGGILLCYHVEKEEIKLLIKKYNISQSFPHTKYEIFCANRVQRVTLWWGVGAKPQGLKGGKNMEVLKFSEMRLKKDKVVFQLPIHKIRSNPYQPRKYFNRAALEELADSIRSYGILQPITVRKMSGGAYELVAGERRLRAAELAGLETIHAILMQVSDSDSAVMAFIENIQRQNLSFLEEAEGYRNMMQDYGLTQEELAAKLSKSQSSIANKLRILKLEDSVKKLLLEHHFTERHARALLKLPDEESRLFVLAQMIQEEMNVKKTEELVEATLEQMRPRYPEKGEQKEKRYVRSSDFRLFTNTIKQSVEVIRRSGVDVVYEDKQDADCCEILIRIRKNAVESA